DPSARLADGDPGSSTALLTAECVVALVEHDQPPPRSKARSAIEAEAAPGGVANMHAAQVWWSARLFGPGEAGGDDAARAAHDLLERHHWHQALREPDLVPDLAR